MATIIVTESNLEEIKASDKTVLLDFYADWCVPCKRLGPVLEDISDENPDIIVGKINVEDEPDIAEEFGIDNTARLPIDPAVASLVDAGKVELVSGEALSAFADEIEHGCGFSH